MENRNPDLLLYIAMADAYAAACEYVRPPHRDRLVADCLACERYHRHPTHRHEPGFYTDDAEMSIANARVLVDQPPPYTPLMFADAYVREFARGGRRDGYARGFQAFLESVRSGEEFLARIRPDSQKNGAAMRAVPFGVIPDRDAVVDAATIQARTTHDTPEGRFSARAVALMAHFSLYTTEPLSAVRSYLARTLPEEDTRRFARTIETPWDERVPVTGLAAPVGLTTTQAAIHLVETGTSLIEMMRRVIRIGGDTDSVAAIVWGIASARFRDERLPEFFARDLEGGSAVTGSASLRFLGAELMERFAGPLG